METWFLIFLFILGLIFGSFLNAIIFRYNTGMTPKGRSFCPDCGKKLNWHELIPIVSFILQKGRCKGCSGRISRQYPLVELITAFLFTATGCELMGSSGIESINPFYLAYTLLIWCLLVIIAVYDLRHKIIPDGPVYSLILLSLAGVLADKFFYPDFLVKGGSAILDFMIGPILFAFVASFWFVSSGRWMGFGDAKLVLGLGWFLGFKTAISGIILGFWSGALAGIFLVVLSRAGKLFLGSEKFTMKSEMPFGPFLILGAILAFFFNPDILSLSVFME